MSREQYPPEFDEALDESEEQEDDNELEEEELAEEGEDDLDGFDGLEALLGESVQIAEARKELKKKGKKASAAATAIVHEAEAEMTWEPTTAIAHHIETQCSCGAKHLRFNAWYILSQHRKDATIHRLLMSDSHEGFPAETYTTVEAADYCHECLKEANLTGVSEWVDILEGLGQPLEAEESTQGELFEEELEEVAEEMGDLLDELLDEAEVEFPTDDDGVLASSDIAYFEGAQ